MNLQNKTEWVRLGTGIKAMVQRLSDGARETVSDSFRGRQVGDSEDFLSLGRLFREAPLCLPARTTTRQRR
ncbi:hypothetical protein RM530_05695 [Algiphilus sp. W345]|uniref:Uncharacterized protein n=1 Tax=Banduia mediterranea TaxID=3075609 RepID=A0ABU2WG68_9GAMM|nr:hypothetical protein [Algiphilus sp. W345]MDT0496856.1 hypothetical protein [Algiphilus sp. W345]